MQPQHGSGWLTHADSMTSLAIAHPAPSPSYTPSWTSILVVASYNAQVGILRSSPVPACRSDDRRGSVGR